MYLSPAMRKGVWIGILFGLLVGCASMTVVPLGEQKVYSPRTVPDKILVFVEKPETTFVQIALLDYTGKSQSSKSGAIKAIKNKAAQIGADAIILQEIDEKTSVSGYVNQYAGWVNTTKKPVVKAIAIRFLP